MAFGDGVAVAYRYHRVLDPLHSLGYFAPETEQALTAAGLQPARAGHPGRMGYFASRSAPMGAVGPGVVTATFYNFCPELVAQHIPHAWTLASPERIVAARLEAIDAAFKRLLGAETLASSDVAEAAELAREATTACSAEGRPLYAGHADLDWPGEPHLVLWHATSLLREYRGDGHVAALVEHGLGGLSALITHTATGRGFLASAAKKTRGWSDEEWDAETGRLRNAGVLDDAGALTEIGEKLRADIEDATNRAAMAPWLHLGEERADRLHELGRALSRRAVAAGAFPEGVFAAPKA